VTRATSTDSRSDARTCSLPDYDATPKDGDDDEDDEDESVVNDE